MDGVGPSRSSDSGVRGSGMEIGHDSDDMVDTRLEGAVCAMIRGFGEMVLDMPVTSSMDWEPYSGPGDGVT